jgi:hypothetical protein
MKKRIINNHAELQEALDYLNDFHDGFLKSIKVISGNKFQQELPWEKKEDSSIEEKLYETDLSLVDKIGLFLEIHHYNYDWPNKPPSNRILLYLSGIRNIDPQIVKMVGKPILNCHTDNQNPELNIALTFETIDLSDPKPGEYRSHPFECKKIYIRERS